MLFLGYVSSQFHIAVGFYVIYKIKSQGKPQNFFILVGINLLPR